jgi:hypothetical protein
MSATVIRSKIEAKSTEENDCVTRPHATTSVAMTREIRCANERADERFDLEEHATSMAFARSKLPAASTNVTKELDSGQIQLPRTYECK